MSRRTSKPLSVVSRSLRKLQQTQPQVEYVTPSVPPGRTDAVPLYDVGTEVRFWTDQVFHVATIAAAALAVGAVT